MEGVPTTSQIGLHLLQTHLLAAAISLHEAFLLLPSPSPNCIDTTHPGSRKKVATRIVSKISNLLDVRVILATIQVRHTHVSIPDCFYIEDMMLIGQSVERLTSAIKHIRNFSSEGPCRTWWRSRQYQRTQLSKSCETLLRPFSQR